MPLSAAGCYIAFYIAFGKRCTLEVLFCHLSVVLVGDLDRMAHPFGDDVDREFFEEFRFSRTTEVMKQSGPLVNASAFHDFFESGPQVHVPPAIRPNGGLTVLFVDNVGAPILGLLEGV